MHDGRGKNRQAYLWQYSRPKGPVVFDFRLGREGKGPNGSLEISKGSSRATATEAMTGWAGQESCMQAVGRMRGANFLMQLNSIPKIKPQLDSWRRWINFLLSRLRLRN